MISGSHKGTQIRPVSKKTAKAPLISGIIKLKHALIGYSPFDGTQSKVNRRGKEGGRGKPKEHEKCLRVLHGSALNVNSRLRD